MIYVVVVLVHGAVAVFGTSTLNLLIHDPEATRSDIASSPHWSCGIHSTAVTQGVASCRGDPRSSQTATGWG